MIIARILVSSHHHEVYFGHNLKKNYIKITRSSATAKSTARPSCLVGVLYDIYREKNNRSTANQPLLYESGHETYRIPRNNAT